jgi:hypothetical protein
LRYARDAIAKRTAWHREIEVKLSVSRVGRVERHSEKALLSRGAGQPADCEKRGQLAGVQVQPHDPAGLLHNIYMIDVAWRSGDKHRLSQTGCYPLSGESRCEPRQTNADEANASNG